MIWTERNEDRHGKDAISREERRIERVIAQAEALYSVRNEVLPCHRELFYTDLEEHLEMETSPTGLFQWVSTWGPVIRHSVQEAKTRSVNGMRLLSTYFQRSEND